MTDPKSISRHREHYTEQYGIEPLHRNPRAGGTYESGLGDTVDMDGNIVPDEYQEFFSEYGSEPPPDVLENFNEQEIQRTMQGDAQPIQWNEFTQAQNQVIELIAKLKDNHIKRILGEAGETLLSRAKDLEKELKEGQGLPPEGQEGLIEKAQSLLEDATEAIDMATAEHQEKISALKTEITALETEIEKSRLSSSNKRNLQNRVDNLKKDLKNSTVDIEKAQSGFEEIKKAFGDTPPEWPRDTILANIPTSNDWHKYDHAVGISNKIAEAFVNDDWHSVIDALNVNIGWHAELPADQGERNRKIMNDVIRKVVTGIYRAAGSMDECLELLKMIPPHVRQRMIEIVSAETGELSERGEGDQWASGGTAEVLRQSLETTP